MKRPWAGLALCLALGIGAGDFLACQCPWWLSGGISALMAVVYLAWAASRKWLLIPLLLVTGMTRLLLDTAVISPMDLRTLIGTQPRLVYLQGQLLRDPQTREYTRSGRTRIRSTVLVQALKISRNGENWRPAFGRIMVTTNGRLREEMIMGSWVTLDGVLHLPNKAPLPGLFDYREHLKRRGVYYQMTVDEVRDWTLNQSAGGLYRQIHNLVLWCRNNLGRGLPEEDLPLRLIGAMTLGLRSALTDEVREPFVKSGTMHVFAISGLHVGMIGAACVGMLVMLRLPRGWCSMMMIPFLWIYAAATGWQPSAVRSVIMFSVILAGWSLQRPPDLLNSMAGAAVILLMWEPQQLFQAGFQLSFAVVFSLLLVVPILEEWLGKHVRPDPFLPRETSSKVQAWMWRKGRQLGALVGGCLVAWAASVPLVAAYFHYLTPVGILANLVMIPLSGFTVMSSLGSCLTGFWFPECAVLFNHSAWFWMSLMIRTSAIAAELPGAWMHVAPPTMSLALLYYTAFFGLLSGLHRDGRKRFWWGMGLMGLGVGACLEARIAWYRDSLMVVPLKGGQMIFHDRPGSRHDLLLDGGDVRSVESVTWPWLRSQGINHIPQWLLTHGDVRHVGGAIELDRHIPAGFVYAGHPSSRSRPYRDALDYFASSSRLIRVGTGQQIGDWQVFHPSKDSSFRQADDHSVVLVGDLSGLRVGLLSDLGQQGQRELMELHPDLRFDLVVAGLPVQSEPVSGAFLRQARPRVVVICDASYPFNARATPKLEARLAAADVEAFYTRHTGAITLEKKGGAWRMVGHASGQVLYRFWGEERVGRDLALRGP